MRKRLRTLLPGLIASATEIAAGLISAWIVFKPGTGPAETPRLTLALSLLLTFGLALRFARLKALPSLRHMLAALFLIGFGHFGGKQILALSRPLQQLWHEYARQNASGPNLITMGLIAIAVFLFAVSVTIMEVSAATEKTQKAREQESLPT